MVPGSGIPQGVWQGVAGNRFQDTPGKRRLQWDPGPRRDRQGRTSPPPRRAWPPHARQAHPRRIAPAARATVARLVRTEAGEDVGDLGDGPRARLEVDTLPWDQARGYAAMQSARWPTIPRTGPGRTSSPPARARIETSGRKLPGPPGNFRHLGRIGSLGKVLTTTTTTQKTHLAETRNRPK